MTSTLPDAADMFIQTVYDFLGTSSHLAYFDA